MRVHRKAVRRIAAGAVLCAVFVACSDPGTPGSTEGSAASVNPTTKLDGVTLTMWAAPNSSLSAKEPIKAFEQATGAKIKVVLAPDPYDNTVPTKLATGAKPDLLFWQPTTSALAKIRGAQTLQPLSGQPWEASLDPSVADLGKVGGVRYSALVTAPSVIGVYYNKAAFRKAGISGIPSSYTSLLTTARRLKSAGITPFFEVGGDKWPLQWTPVVLMADLTRSGTFWPKLNKNEESWTNPAIVSTISQYKAELDAGLVNENFKTATFADQGSAIYSEKAAMAVQLTALGNEMATGHSAQEIDQAVGFFPISPKGNIGTYEPDQSNAVVLPKTGNAKREAAARQFLAFWLGPNYANYIAETKTVSIESKVPTPNTVPQLAVDNFKALRNSVGAYQVEGAVAPDLYLFLADMIFGRKSPEEVAKACQDQFKQGAKAQGLPGFN